KHAMKTLFQAAGLMVAPWRLVRDHAWRSDRAAVLEDLEAALPLPLFVKPANLGSSVGISKVSAITDLADAVDAALAFDPRVVVERAVPRAREIECAVLGHDAPEASEPGEIIPDGEFYDYDAKYLRSGSRTIVPAGLPADAGRAVHPHFIDTRSVPWIINPGLPDIALKILRVSEETGTVSLIVRHNGVAGPHYHLGAADFMVLSGRIGYRAGPPDGYGPGVWFYEPAGARHDATQRIGDEDLIYTANVYGPIQFDTGRGTPVAAVLSWIQYKELADAAGVELVRNTFAGDASLLAWAPLGAAAKAA
ncbi:MAG: cupin domain-containing protein, partial [Steroidobacteraceae bacterium]